MLLGFALGFLAGLGLVSGIALHYASAWHQEREKRRVLQGASEKLARAFADLTFQEQRTRELLVREKRRRQMAGLPLLISKN